MNVQREIRGNSEAKDFHFNENLKGKTRTRFKWNHIN